MPTLRGECLHQGWEGWKPEAVRGSVPPGPSPGRWVRAGRAGLSPDAEVHSASASDLLWPLEPSLLCSRPQFPSEKGWPKSPSCSPTLVRLPPPPVQLCWAVSLTQGSSVYIHNGPRGPMRPPELCALPEEAHVHSPWGEPSSDPLSFLEILRCFHDPKRAKQSWVGPHLYYCPEPCCFGVPPHLHRGCP